MEALNIIGIIFNSSGVGIIIYFLIKYMNKVDANEEKVQEIEINYINRFDDLKDTINKKLEPINTSISTLLERTKKI